MPLIKHNYNYDGQSHGMLALTIFTDILPIILFPTKISFARALPIKSMT